MTKGGDEPCQMFRASKIFRDRDEATFVETARRAKDSKYHPNLARLKARVVQAIEKGRPLKIEACRCSAMF